MRKFNYEHIDQELLDKEIVALLTELHEFRGKQEFYMESYSDVLEAMVRVAKVQSTGASNRIEGIYTSEEKLGDLVSEKTEPKNQNERRNCRIRNICDYILSRSMLLISLFIRFTIKCFLAISIFYFIFFTYLSHYLFIIGYGRQNGLHIMISVSVKLIRIQYL